MVSEIFEKEHKHVLQSIRDIMRSAENSAHLYASIPYTDSMNRKQECFFMNRDGFSLLAMGFTGEKALQWKLKYIDAFNKMEEIIRSGGLALPNFNNPVDAARAWADAEEKRQVAEKKIEALLPKANFADKVMDTDDMVDIGQAAKLLKVKVNGKTIGRNRLFAYLRKNGIFFKNRNEPKQEYYERGYFDFREKVIERENHEPFTVTKILVTQKGLVWLSKQIESNFKPGIPALSAQ